ncbi:beta strand repeat-containing protein [Mesorhizobium sp. IMUNJ 23232]|uniref:beta strand repeat-containing protein n=1 Tax=Mesorhizobium sp. IMUNJ 23232 TaxID=3376064 RepID=UPI00379468FB
MAIIDGDGTDNFLVGSAFADTLNGFGGNDRLAGLGGPDFLDGSVGIDTADYSFSGAAVFIDRINFTAEGGDAEGDTLISIENFIGSAFDDGFFTDNGSNAIFGGAGNDFILANGGDDVIAGGLGGDTISGGDGIDLANYEGSNFGVVVDLLNGKVSGGDAAGDILSGIENLRGSAVGDTLGLDNSNNTIDGRSGDDILLGFGGNDTLIGGAGFDDLSGGDQDDTLTGGADGDFLKGDAGFDTAVYTGSDAAVSINLAGGFSTGGDAQGDLLSSIEKVIGSFFNDAFQGGEAGEQFFGSLGIDTIFGGGAADHLDGGLDQDNLHGDAGDDILVGGFAGDNIDGGDGIDTATYVDSGAAVNIVMLLAIAQGGDAEGDTFTNVENLNGSNFDDNLGGDTGDNRIRGLDGADQLGGISGDDRLEGGLGDDTLNGDADNDTLIGGAGADKLDGGTGIDIADYSASSGAVAVSLRLNSGSGGDAQGDTFTGIEQVVGSALIDDLEGDNAANRLFGGGQDDVLRGGGGGDTLDGGAGGDTLLGGEGNDLYIVTRTDTIIEAAGEGTADRAAATESFTLGNGDNIEILSTTETKGFSDINLTGNTLKQEILGNAGFNVLHTGGGTADVMKGFGGNDIYRVFNSGDIVVETAGSGFDLVLAAVDYKLGAGAEVERLFTNSSTGTSAIDLTGNAFQQEIAGNAGANTLHDGGAGEFDLMRGFGGNDTYRVFNSGDVIVESTSQGNADKVVAAVDYKLGAGVDIEIVQTNGSTGTTTIDLTGNEFGQQIIGNAGANRIEGKGGIDTLRGGSGADTFVFASTLGAANVDKILDFSVPADRMLLSDAIFTALDTGTLSAAAFRVNNTGLAQDASDHIIYERDSGKLFYDADGLGGLAGIHFATLTVGLALTSADFSVA